MRGALLVFREFMQMFPHILLGLLVLLGFVGRPWWVVLVAAAALTVASLEYVEARGAQTERAMHDGAYFRSIANNAGDSLAYSSLAYILGWLAASIVGFA
jgi:ABC-type dipeptide/oligopeptide/nickel transport system permease subunit